MSATVIVTGGNRGIGRSITESFVKAGYTVIVGARTEQNIQAIDPKNVIFQLIDVRDEAAHFTLDPDLETTDSPYWTANPVSYTPLS